MKKYKNLSGIEAGFIDRGKTFDFENGEICSVPDDFKNRLLKFANGLVPIKEEKPTPVEAPPIPTFKPGDILDQNVRTVKKILRERELTKSQLEKLLAHEEARKNRKLIIGRLKRLLK